MMLVKTDVAFNADGGLPVAIRSSTTITVWPGLIASACISKESCRIHSVVERVFLVSEEEVLLTVPYSFS